MVSMDMGQREFYDPPFESQSQDPYSQQLTQTQPQTQPYSQHGITPVNSFPVNLWGVLVSWAAPSTYNQTSRLNLEDDLREKMVGTSAEPYTERPARIEMSWGKELVKFGRHPKADIVFKGNKISSWHAHIFYDRVDGKVKLGDTSTNGTWVRGEKVGQGKYTILEQGDTVVFGPTTADLSADFRYIFQCPPPISSSQPRYLGDSAAINGTTTSSTRPLTISEPQKGILAKFEIREVIGKGSFATVKKGVQRSTGKMVAIKVIEKARFAANPKTMELIQREVEIMKKIDHRSCVRWIDYFEDESKMWLVMEFIDGGDLLDYIMKRKGLSEKETKDIAQQVGEAVAYLHSKGVAHRDLKPENVVMTRGLSPVFKVTDFGLAKMAINNETMFKTMCGTPAYLAPEVVLNSKEAYNTSVDAWSLGVVLYSCLTNSTPFDESESAPLEERMRQRTVDFDYVREFGVSEECVDFLRRLLTLDPKQRMTVAASLKHPWLSPSRPGLTEEPPNTLLQNLAKPAQVLESTKHAQPTKPLTESEQGDPLREGCPKSVNSSNISTPDLEEQSEGIVEDDVGYISANTIPDTPRIDRQDMVATLAINNSPPHIPDLKRKYPQEPSSAFSSDSNLSERRTINGMSSEIMSVDSLGPNIEPVQGVESLPSLAFDLNLESVPESRVLDMTVEPCSASSARVAGSTRKRNATPSKSDFSTPDKRNGTLTSPRGVRVSGGARKNGVGSPVIVSPLSDIGVITRRRAKVARLTY